MKVLCALLLIILTGCALNIGSGSSVVSGERDWDGNMLDIEAPLESDDN